ncbi:hypothetical protein ASC87_14400 [Rhizobacter sp. Root1221]|nr:hypothetical protein ASC87_14400 [Rhizobacter sp. Root1221]
MEVSDRFPMLGFSIRVDEPNVEAEVVLANDIALFDVQNKARRHAGNFYTSRENGTLMVPRGDGVFVVAPEVLSRFVGSDKLYFGLATGRSGNGGLKIDALPREGSPYVSLRGFTGRSLRRNFGNGRHGVAPRLEWIGDTPRPGSESARPAGEPAPIGRTGAVNGAPAGTTPAASGGAYDDGFGPMPAIPARESAYRGATAARRSTPQMGITLSSGMTPGDALAWVRSKVEQVVGELGHAVDPPVISRLGDGSSTFITAWQATFGVSGLLLPVNAFLALIPKLAREAGVTLSIGPAFDTPLFGGGLGVVFAPDGQVALFGTSEISDDVSSLAEVVSSLKLALQAKMKLGYNVGGIEGFASLGKVVSKSLGDEIVVGAEAWLDGAGNGLGGAVSIGVGFALELSANAQARRTPASAMVAGLEDRQKVRRHAGDFRDIFQWTVPASVVNEINARGFSLQTIDAAVGDLNLDFYKVDITRFPSGWDGPKLLQHFMRNINQYIDTRNTEFTPFSDQDAQRLASANPLGTVFRLNILGPDNAAVVISDVKPQYFSVSTIYTPETGDHPVSGHRMFGYANEPGKTVFFTRAADRPSLLPMGFQEAIFFGADKLWRSMQSKVVAFVNDNGGVATIIEPFSERFNPTAVREEFGHYDVARGMSMDTANAAFVPTALPGDTRTRAERIGGSFAGRVGEALDLGLAPKALDALLNLLDPTALAQPMSAVRRTGSVIAKAQATTRSINWDDVELIPQPTDFSCWAAAAAMVIGWRDQVSLTPDTVGEICARPTVAGLSPYDRAVFAGEIGLQAEPPQSYSVDGFYDLLTYSGPLWVSKIAGGGATSGHAVVITGMYSDGDRHFVRVADPLDRIVGTPGAPGGYASTHATGSRYIMRYEDFQNEYELRIVGNPPTPQVLHAGGTGGRVPNTGTASAPQGYAMAAGRKTAAAMPSRAHALDAAAIATIGGAAVTQRACDSGGVAWQLPQWAGRKHPNDVVPASDAPFQPSVISLTGWPSVGGTTADAMLRWRYNGTSIESVGAEPGPAQVAAGWGLRVTGTVEDDVQLHARSAAAPVPGASQVPALHVVLTYEFQAPTPEAAPTATSRITLYADGTYEIDNEWVPRSAGSGPDAPVQADARDAARTSSPLLIG